MFEMSIFSLIAFSAVHFFVLYYVIAWAVEHGINRSKLVRKNEKPNNESEVDRDLP